MKLARITLKACALAILVHSLPVMALYRKAKADRN